MMERDRSARAMAVLLMLALLAFAIPAAAQDGGAEEEEKGWTGGVKLGVTNSTGKTDVFSGSFNVDLERDWEKDRLRFELRTVYASKNEKISTGRLGTRTQTRTDESAQKLEGSWRRVLHERLFVISKAEVGRDEQQDIELRTAFHVGPGYRFWEKDKQKKYLDLALGVGYRREQYSDDTTDSLDAADVGVGFDYRNEFFDGKINYKHTADVLMPVNDPNAFLVRTELGFGVPVVGGWAVSVTYALEYVNDPAEDAQSVTTRLTGGLEYAF